MQRNCLCCGGMTVPRCSITQTPQPAMALMETASLKCSSPSPHLITFLLIFFVSSDVVWNTKQITCQFLSAH